MGRAAGWVAVVLSMGWVPGVAWAHEDGRVRVVDDDREQCPRAAYETISAAVAAASPGDVVYVCPGHYEESVTVPKTLTLIGSGPSSAKRRTGDPTREAVIEPPGTEAVFLEADRIVFKLFTVQRPPVAVSSIGLQTSARASGYRIEANAFRNFGIAMSVESDNRLPVTIIENDVRGGDLGLRLNLVSDAKIVANRFVGVGAAVVCGGCAHLAVKENYLDTGSNVGMELSRLRNSIIAKNRIVGAGDLGIFVDSAEAVRIVENEISNVRFGSGIRLTGSTRCEIAENEIRGINFSNELPYYTGGIAVFSSTEITVDHNLVDRVNGDGLLLAFSSTGNLVKENYSFRSTGNGIHVTEGSTGNRLLENVSLYHGEFDANDDARPLNVWEDTWCQTDFPAGTICPH